MILTIIIGIIVAVCLVSTLIIYVFIRSNENSKVSLNEKQRIRYSFTPSFDIFTKELPQRFLFRGSTSSDKSNRSSFGFNPYEENSSILRKASKSVESISASVIPARSVSLVTNLIDARRPRTPNWRPGSIVDPNQLASIQFTLPLINNDDKYRRRSVPVFNRVTETQENPLTIINSTLPCLLSFSITYLNTSQLKVQFHSLNGLPTNVQLQQLIIKVKLVPDGKEKSIQMKKLIQNGIKFENNDESSILFSNIQLEKIHEKQFSMNIHGKDQTKKSIHLGQIGKIYLNQIHQWEDENPLEFVHEIEKIKSSSVELFVSLERKGDQHIRVDLQRIKGLKIDQKKLDAQCYIQVLLLDHHRPLITKQTKFYRLNSSNFPLGEQYDLNILTFNSNNLDRFMIMINLYSNSNHSNEYKRIAHVKLASPMFCSGSGTVHWQQFKARDSFSMWHTLNKQQH